MKTKKEESWLKEENYWLTTLIQKCGAGIRHIWRRGRSPFTILLIPHGEKEALSFKVSIRSLVIFSTLLLSLPIGTLLFSMQAKKSAGLAGSIVDKREDFAQFQEEMDKLLSASLVLTDSLNRTLASIAGTSEETLFPESGDIAQLYVGDTALSAESEISQMQMMRSQLESSSAALKSVEDSMKSYELIDSILSQLPVYWPVNENRGIITNRYGLSTHPFFKTSYLHKGLDIAYHQPIPIVATANGRINKVSYDRAGYGNYIVIRHEYGYNTLYAHLSRTFVQVGQTVKQGEIIGMMGNTGLSTGTHLHYELQLGTQTVNPTPYLRVYAPAHLLRYMDSTIDSRYGRS